MGWNLALLLLAKLCAPGWGCIGQRKGPFCNLSARVEFHFVTCTKMHYVLEVALAKNIIEVVVSYPITTVEQSWALPTHLFTSHEWEEEGAF